ncbi:hypothetical protein ABT354_30180 [Streptomyces sp. NPDC000594]|uniref:hypothetical protein n=1 Tax=Streptomyces sp. NPDC000594 TaxID=3154261 RepID=UPI00331D9D0B
MSTTTTRPRTRPHTASHGTVLPWRSLASLGIEPGFTGLLDIGAPEDPQIPAAAPVPAAVAVPGTPDGSAPRDDTPTGPAHPDRQED